MKLLLDQNLSFKLAPRLNDLCRDIVHVRDVGLDQADDSIVWDFARNGDFIIVTMDSDFAELASLLGSPPRVVWLRCGNQPTAIIEQKIRGAWSAMQVFAIWETSVLEIY